MDITEALASIFEIYENQLLVGRGFATSWGKFVFLEKIGVVSQPKIKGIGVRISLLDIIHVIGHFLVGRFSY